MIITGKGNRTVDILGTVGLFLFAFSSLLSTSGASLGLALLVGAMLLQPSAWRGLQRDPLIVVGVVSTFYLVARTLWAIREFPETLHLQVRQAWEWFGLWLFVAVAWWLKGDVRRIGWVLFLSFLGLVSGMAYAITGHAQILWSGERSGFHLRIMPFGLYSSTAILGLLLFAPRIWGPRSRLVCMVLRIILWVVALALLVQGLIVTQSRGAWLTAAVVIPVVALLRYKEVCSNRVGSWRLRAALLGLALLASVALFAVNFRTMTSRLSQENQTLAAIARGDFGAVPTFGIGARVHALRFGVTKWLERPIIGWGPGSSEHLITQSGFGQLRFDGAPNEGWKTGKPWLDHLFNTYLEMLVRFGLAGALFALAAFGLLGKGLWHAHLEGRVPRDFGLFLVGSMLLMASWCFFEFRLLRPDWRSYWILIGGAVATFRWHVRSIDSSSIADTS